jgi:hypothetical protein
MDAPASGSWILLHSQRQRSSCASVLGPNSAPHSLTLALPIRRRVISSTSTISQTGRPGNHTQNAVQPLVGYTHDLAKRQGAETGSRKDLLSNTYPTRVSDPAPLPHWSLRDQQPDRPGAASSATIVLNSTDALLGLSFLYLHVTPTSCDLSNDYAHGMTKGDRFCLPA